MVSPKEYLLDIQKQVDAELDRLLPPVSVIPTRLHEALRYSVFAGGKRLRPALCITSCEAMGGDRKLAMISAAALEALHTYTLIHDDLPAMDDDDMRRGKPSCHKAFDEATAILAGDALLTCAFQWLAETGNSRLVAELAIATGSRGTVGGQVDDMMAKLNSLSEEEIISIHERKTALLFSVSCRLGAIVAGATDTDIDALGAWGKSLGVAFQLLDDVCDNDPVTMDSFSREGAIARAKQYEEEAATWLAKVSGNTEVLTATGNLLIASFAL
ncbi:MAG: hypothetical protein A3C02_01330 [Candidatus Andersenbacteria bacterium RIFCSPHIGHO2_02_FULL_45_11]|uniref:Polyprenyl synthetase n=1 Tax=Candidatus Andersenbacteria bacterium RIFCSPHIGHO2_12_FULL_45_11 TaxID=1797281 RepID=A0A1G1X4V7_9BACT|nr:MAG: hypothetical protein A2805_00110 [Candidatus Andersenbacteria bacterium RIFCSPHIGHO2_01_FULL_46_36]OGY34367.1 MAG: hypothetical protein A3D99_02540 [Candidatus Andersenbacteria bacterium RIFCSPHIGHO2_12_FULL_45_11]OGY34946.1 MAG: hypothetical protein A3C02_01330 [Candidatus Andersenbacteria bacterium RIFCSPHIGHO2_02_FULL_45_11]